MYPINPLFLDHVFGAFPVRKCQKSHFFCTFLISSENLMKNIQKSLFLAFSEFLIFVQFFRQNCSKCTKYFPLICGMLGNFGEFTYFFRWFMWGFRPCLRGFLFTFSITFKATCLHSGQERLRVLLQKDSKYAFLNVFNQIFTAYEEMF